MFRFMPISTCSGQYMVGGGGLKQHVNYNISCILLAVINASDCILMDSSRTVETAMSRSKGRWSPLNVPGMWKFFALIPEKIFGIETRYERWPLGRGIEADLGMFERRIQFLSAPGHDFLAETRLSQFAHFFQPRGWASLYRTISKNLKYFWSHHAAG